MEVEVKYNQSIIDVAIEHLGSAELALDIALLNGISLTDVLVPGTSLLLPEVKPQANTEALPVVAPVTSASLLGLLTAHTAIMGGAVAGHVRNGGDVRIDPEGRMWVELISDHPDWANIDNKPLTFPPSAHGHMWAEIIDPPSVPPQVQSNMSQMNSEEPDFVKNKYAENIALVTDTFNKNLDDTVTDIQLFAEKVDELDGSKWENIENELITDFYMPSLDELQLIRDVSYGFGIILNEWDKVWSSSEKDFGNAFYINFRTNEMGIAPKNQQMFSAIRCRQIQSSSKYYIGGYTPDGGFIFFIEENSSYKTYWTAYKVPIASWTFWADSSLPGLIGTTSRDFGEGINNTNEIIAIDQPSHFTAAYFIRNYGTTIDNSMLVKPKEGKYTKTDFVKEGENRYFTENRVLQTRLNSVSPPATATNITANDSFSAAFGKLSKWFDYFLPKNTSLQPEGSPNMHDLFSFHDILSNIRKKISWNSILNILDDRYPPRVYNVFTSAKDSELEIDKDTIVYNDVLFENGSWLAVYISSEDFVSHTFSELQILIGASPPNVADISFHGDIVWLDGTIPVYRVKKRYIFRFVYVKSGEIHATWRECLI